MKISLNSLKSGILLNCTCWKFPNQLSKSPKLRTLRNLRRSQRLHKQATRQLVLLYEIKRNVRINSLRGAINGIETLRFFGSSGRPQRLMDSPVHLPSRYLGSNGSKAGWPQDLSLSCIHVWDYKCIFHLHVPLHIIMLWWLGLRTNLFLSPISFLKGKELIPPSPCSACLCVSPTLNFKTDFHETWHGHNAEDRPPVRDCIISYNQ
jgi:hypothetical protein